MKIKRLEVTPREKKVWLAICAGHRTEQIAADRGWTAYEVRKERHNLLLKLGIPQRGRGALDVAAIVRAAFSADILKELPPLTIATSARPTDSKLP